jgi:c(7)-type cytochrome triheme protein
MSLRSSAVALLALTAFAEQQPIPYSHKTHLAMGLKCNACHKNPDPGEAMGLPPESFCMGCHRTVKADSPHIQKLATTKIPWVRVYQLPSFVYFSHRLHTQAGASCETCHGPVRDRDVIVKEIPNNMQSCMACHAEKKARNDCNACHEEK